MGAKRGRLEGTFTLSGSDTITFDDSVAAAQVVTPPAGDYTITSLVAYLVATVVGGGHWSITFSGGESGTGKITIDTSDRPFTVTWSSSTMRDLMGFAANISAVSAAQIGTKQCRGVWLPDVEKWTPHGDDDGNGSAFVRNVAGTSMMNGTGAMKTIIDSSWYTYTVRWQGVSRARAKLIGVSTTYESFERFWGDTQLSDVSLFSAGSPIRIYWDADAATYTTVKVAAFDRFDPVRMVENWVGRYTIELPQVVKQ